MLIFSKNGMESQSIMLPNPHPCVFEYIYFARPDSRVFGRLVYDIRKNMGEELARENPVEADLVIPVPDSGVAAALGYSRQSGIPFELGIIRNHYVGRTFIEPTQQIRELKVKLKLNPIRELIENKRVVVIDDSVVRGTTSRQIVKILRDCGANPYENFFSANDFSLLLWCRYSKQRGFNQCKNEPPRGLSVYWCGFFVLFVR